MVRPRSNIGRRTNRSRRQQSNRAIATTEQRVQRNEATRHRNVRTRATLLRQNLNRAAFNYDPDIPYGSHKSVIIGAMTSVCRYCKSFKFKNEPPGLCCASGKVKLPTLNSPPEPLRSLVLGETAQSKHFLKNIQIYNSSFQMTSFGATNIIRDNLMPIFKVIFDHDLSSDGGLFHIYDTIFFRYCMISLYRFKAKFITE